MGLNSRKVCARQQFNEGRQSATAANGDTCGSNTLPDGLSSRDARARFGVYDLNGNAAEHMNLPLDRGPDGEPGQLQARRMLR